MSLEKIKVGHSPLTNNIYMYRHGKNPRIALEKRIATSEVLGVVIEHVMHDSPAGATLTISGPIGAEYELTVKPVSRQPS